MNAKIFADTVHSSPEQYLELGLRDAWYPVLSSWEVHDNPVGITRLGENIALWRDEHPDADFVQGWQAGEAHGGCAAQAGADGADQAVHELRIRTEHEEHEEHEEKRTTNYTDF